MSDRGESAGKDMSCIWSKTVSFGSGDSGKTSWWGTGMNGFINLLICLMDLLLSGMRS